MLDINTLQLALMECKAQTYTFPHMLRCTGMHLTSLESFRKVGKITLQSIFTYKANRRLSKRGPERDTHRLILFITGANSDRVLRAEEGALSYVLRPTLEGDSRPKLPRHDFA